MRASAAGPHPCQGRGRGFESLRPLQFLFRNQAFRRYQRVQSAYIGRLATGCKRFVSSRIWSVPSALRRRMGREAPEPNRSRERPGKPHTEQCNAAAALRLASGACHESKSCCRGLGRPRITSRPERRAKTGRIRWDESELLRHRRLSFSTERHSSLRGNAPFHDS